MNEVDEQRAKMIGIEGCREFSRRYIAAAKKLRQRYGKRAAFRREWLTSAWFFRKAAKGE